LQYRLKFSVQPWNQTMHFLRVIPVTQNHFQTQSHYVPHLLQAVAVLLQTIIQQAFCSNLCWNTNYPDCGFHWAFLVNVMIVPQSSYDRLLTNPFPIYYSPIIISFDAHCIAGLLTTVKNKP
jgi:hypothetical protein